MMTDINTEEITRHEFEKIGVPQVRALIAANHYHNMGTLALAVKWLAEKDQEADRLTASSHAEMAATAAERAAAAAEAQARTAKHALITAIAATVIAAIALIISIIAALHITR